MRAPDLVPIAHHAFMATFARTVAMEIIENHMGVAFIEHLPPAAA